MLESLVKPVIKNSASPLVWVSIHHDPQMPVLFGRPFSSPAFLKGIPAVTCFPMPSPA